VLGLDPALATVYVAIIGTVGSIVVTILSLIRRITSPELRHSVNDYDALRDLARDHAKASVSLARTAASMSNVDRSVRLLLISFADQLEQAAAEEERHYEARWSRRSR
jgi:hypothetical protein